MNISEENLHTLDNIIPDLIFSSSMGAMGASGLILIISGDDVFLANLFNFHYVGDKYDRLLDSLYEKVPELKLLVKWDSTVTIKPYLELQDLGMGNEILINTDKITSITNYRSFVKYVFDFTSLGIGQLYEFSLLKNVDNKLMS